MSDDKPVCPVCGAAIRREVFHEDGARVDQWHCLTCGYTEYADDEAVRLAQATFDEWAQELDKRCDHPGAAN